MADELTIFQFFGCLFDVGEYTCITASPKGTEVGAIFDLRYPLGFFSINPLEAHKDHNPTEDWHRPDRGRRADCNVTKFRNILIEMDKVPLELQDQLIAEKGVPYSTAVYSGGKSIHYIISLVTPCAGQKEYKRLVERVYRAVGKTLVDIANKNPSRLSRLPGHFRQDTGHIQKLLAVKGRVPNEMLETWLEVNGAPKVAEDDRWEDLSRSTGQPRDFSSLSGFTKNFLMHGAQENWNFSLFKAAADMARNGFAEDEATAELSKITGILDKNDEKTIKSAYRNEYSTKNPL